MTIEKPILFSAPMVNAILSGVKTQCRRTVKWPDWIDDYEFAAAALSFPGGILRHNDGREFAKPYTVGTVLWVRETFVIESSQGLDPYAPPHNDGRPIKLISNDDEGNYWECPHYRATDPIPDLFYEDKDEPYCKWKPSIFMPRWASRLTLLVTAVRVERVNTISAADALAEGIVKTNDGGYAYDTEGRGYHGSDPRASYRHLWDKINGAGSFDSGVWCWAYMFSRVTA